MATAFGVDSVNSRTNWSSRRPDSADLPTAQRSDAALQGDLAALIEGEIIPRLITAHRDAKAAPAAPSERVVLPQEAADFARLPLTLEADELLDRVEVLLAGGVEPGSILVDLLAPSARELGRMWEEDECSFVDVTMGLWRLQEVMRELAWRAPSTPDRATASRSVLFSGIPGEQHSFGTLMISELFIRAGWRSEALIEPSRHDLLAAIEAEPFDLVGLTVSCDCPSGELRKLIRAIRSVSHNPQLRVMIGGRVVNANPSLVDECGADGTAPDAHSALAFADCLVHGTQRLAMNAC